MTQTKIKVAIAGAGMVTRHHLKAWVCLPQAEVVAICARRLKNAEARAAEFGIPRAYADVAEMLDKEKPHALDIATPPDVHASQVRMAAERGINVLCQKPMTPSLAESEQLVNEVGEKVRFMVHENWRFRPQYRQAAQWLAHGKAGPIREFEMVTRSSGLVTRTASGRLFALERQPFFSRLKRFILLELLIHHLDTTRFLVGPLRVITARSAHISPEVIGEDVALITLEAENGAFGTVLGNLSAVGWPPLPTDRLELIGERASIIFENDVLKLVGEQEESVHFDMEAAYQASYDNAIAHFVEALRTSKPFETDRLDNLQTLRLVEEAYRKAGL